MVTKTDQLASGTYYILDSARRIYVGRSLQEEISILPKPIVSVSLAEGCSPPKVCSITSLFWFGASLNKIALLRPQWIVERRPNGTYTLRIANAPVEAVRGALYAFLHPNDVPDEWVILPARGDLYT